MPFLFFTGIDNFRAQIKGIKQNSNAKFFRQTSATDCISGQFEFIRLAMTEYYTRYCQICQKIYQKAANSLYADTCSRIPAEKEMTGDIFARL